ncbi:MAG: 4-hydroxythreonine-4-phosphate dehydrogenase PdxA [Marivibrio sp.]|uniref:4-hydroxythreonine-4-phosphate dehydrogenase PdxA n=1 Tax=Marivibrio sp. TaxID=2039719 RepID=UPI0032EE7B43
MADGAPEVRTPPLAVTMGEPAGVGGEIALAAWTRRAGEDLSPFFMIDDPDRLTALARKIGLDAPVAAIDAPSEAPGVFGRALPVLPLRGGCADATPGAPHPAHAPSVIESIDRAVRAAQSGEAAGVVTNPIQKSALYEAGFTHPGHTEYLAALTGAERSVMMLVAPGLRAVPVTIHRPLAKAVQELTTDMIVETGRITAAALARDFAIAAPRLALAGLNPHAGEGGALGREEIEIIAPAAEILRADGITVLGPLPGDTMFHAEARETYDAALGMYHDQALIPVKTLDFHGGVNMTLGLPIIRTSPDHGTALTLAGAGVARPDSLIAALRLAARAAANRARAPGAHQP